MQVFGLTPDDGPMALVRLASMPRADALVIGSALMLYHHIAGETARLGRTHDWRVNRNARWHKMRARADTV